MSCVLRVIVEKLNVEALLAKKYRVTLTGKQYVFLTATKIT